MENTYEKVRALKNNIQKVIVGKDDTINLILTALVAGGHVLIEDSPGTGKTLLAKTLAASMEADFSRIQFTPDLLPADITGLNVYSQKDGDFHFVEGPVMTNILLADEINRAMPRTQSALLEAMEERQVTIDRKSHKLADPFMVVATQNPIETAGTFPLPEAQLDRFMMMLSMEMPTRDEEIQMLGRFAKDKNEPLEAIMPVIAKDDIAAFMQCASEVYVHEDIIGYLVEIVEATRANPAIRCGVSPRGSLSCLYAAKAYAFVAGRDYVLPDDIKTLAVPALCHRIICYTQNSRKEKAALINEILEKITVPSEDFKRR